MTTFTTLTLAQAQADFDRTLHASRLAYSSTTPTVAPALELVDDATYGMCSACGAIEVALVKPSGTRDLSAMGESAAYPIGYGCELCS